MHQANDTEDIRRRLSLLGTPGYSAKLRGLKGPLERFNGQMVLPRRNSSGFVVVVNGSDVSELKVRRQHIEIFEDWNEKAKMNRRRLNEAVSSSSSSSSTGRNRGNVASALTGLSAQVRSAFRVAAKRYGDEEKGFKEVFKTFDADGNGEIDKTEFNDGLKTLGLRVSHAECELLWPFFDLDGSNGIDFEEMLAFIKRGGTAGETASRSGA